MPAIPEPWRTRFQNAANAAQRRAVIREWRQWNKDEKRASRELTKFMREEMRRLDNDGELSR